MKRFRAVPLIAAALTLVLSLVAAPSVFAHASVTSVRWDNPAAPTRLIASTDDAVSSNSGEFSLKVLNSSGIQVDNGNATIVAPFTEVSVGVPASLPSGTYTVQWTVTSSDGHVESGTHTIALNRGSSAMPAATPATGGHSHGAATMDDHDAAPDDHSSIAKMEKVTIELNLTGAQETPPVTSPATAFARLTIDPETNMITWAITVSGVAPQAVTGLHIHSGAPGQNGPHLYDIINAPFTTTSGSAKLSDAAIAELYSGNTYLRLHTTAFPAGAARAQIVIPSDHDHSTHDHGTTVTPTASVRPPSTGDAGLAAPAASHGAAAVVVAVAAVLSFGAAGAFVAVRR